MEPVKIRQKQKIRIYQQMMWVPLLLWTKSSPFSPSLLSMMQKNVQEEKWPVNSKKAQKEGLPTKPGSDLLWPSDFALWISHCIAIQLLLNTVKYAAMSGIKKTTGILTCHVNIKKA